jgi:prepilin-type N-terminal cleavage/methylation domain-containing protein
MISPFRFRHRRSRHGFTLVEVVVALGILSIAMLSLAKFVSTMAHTTTLARLQSTSTDLTSDRIEAVTSATVYATIESLFVATEVNIPGPPEYQGFTRQTLVTHIGGGSTDSVDYKVITVIVTHPLLSTSVRKSTAIASF